MLGKNKIETKEIQMKKAKLIFMLIGMVFIISGLNASNMEVSGTISTNTTWTGVDTVKVTDDIITDNNTNQEIKIKQIFR